MQRRDLVLQSSNPLIFAFSLHRVALPTAFHPASMILLESKQARAPHPMSRGAPGETDAPDRLRYAGRSIVHWAGECTLIAIMRDLEGSSCTFPIMAFQTRPSTSPSLYASMIITYNINTTASP